jgi:CAAX protease family protein
VGDAEARRDIWTFLTLLLLFSSIFYALVLCVPDAPKQWGNYVLLFMWCPGLAALITKVVRDRSLRGLGWRAGRARYFLIAYGTAIAVCLLSYVSVWYACGAFSRSHFVEALSKAGLPPALRGRAGLPLLVLMVLPLTNLIGAAGEEIGWRGFLVPRMHALLGFTRTSLLVGLIWAAWHYPINVAVTPLYRPNVPLWYSNACFTVVVIGVSFMHTWLRMRSQSVWPSALFHAAGNAFQGVLQAATLETRLTSYLTTEYGASFAVVGCLLAVVFWRKRHEVEAG